MPSLPSGFVFSQSSLQDYTDCARRFELRYLQRLQWPAVESEPALENERRQQEGQLFHRLVQQHLIGIPEERLTRLAASADLRRWWNNYRAQPLSLDDYAKYTEATLSAPLGAFRLLAKYDLIAMQPGQRAVIYDWKTYAKRPRNEWMAARLQTRVYRALLVRAGAHLNGGTPIPPHQVEMIYWYADYPAEPARFTYSLAQYERDWAGLEKLAEEIAAAQAFPPTEDEKRCAFCVYRSYCERGVHAGQGGEAESELSEPEIDLEQIQEIAF
ncbi:MAG: PD-(D/E)XK nuclease family protein [Anaerolineales bacterium]